MFACFLRFYNFSFFDENIALDKLVAFGRALLDAYPARRAFGIFGDGYSVDHRDALFRAGTNASLALDAPDFATLYHGCFYDSPIGA